MSYLYVQGWRLADECWVLSASLSGGTGDPEIRGLRPVPGLSSPGHWPGHQSWASARLWLVTRGQPWPLIGWQWLSPQPWSHRPALGSGHWRQMPHGPNKSSA